MNFSQTSVRFIFGITLAVLCLVAALLFARSFHAGTNTVNTDRTAVVQKIQALGNLETSSFTIEKVIEANNSETNVFRNILFGDTLLLIAKGTVTAGFDVSAMTKENIQVEQGEVVIQLGSPTIFSVVLDNKETKVYDRRTGFLSKGNKNLETEARAAAEASIRQAACDGGILDEAGKSGKELIEKMMRFSGIEKVRVEIKPGSC
jgi:hypothetical protein